MVEVVTGDNPHVGENEENVGKPEQDSEQFQAPVEPEPVISKATVGVFHQDESAIHIRYSHVQNLQVVMKVF